MLAIDARTKTTSFGVSNSQVAPTIARNVAIDAYRGFVMLLMMGEVLRFVRVSRAYPDSRLLAFLAYNQTHVPWAGCSLHDLIQPSFSFLVGVALSYSVARRIANGDNGPSLFKHALWRSLILIALGIFLRSVDRPQTNFTFEDTLTQIGLGYPFLFLLSFQAPRVQWGAVSALLIVYWAAWALYPLPGPGYDYQAVRVSPDWPYNFGGFMAHWNRSSNLGLAFDHWFLNLFPREQPFVAAWPFTMGATRRS
jgi:predicted acyltransferase